MFCMIALAIPGFEKAMFRTYSVSRSGAGTPSETWLWLDGHRLHSMLSFVYNLCVCLCTYAMAVIYRDCHPKTCQGKCNNLQHLVSIQPGLSKRGGGVSVQPDLQWWCRYITSHGVHCFRSQCIACRCLMAINGDCLLMIAHDLAASAQVRSRH